MSEKNPDNPVVSLISLGCAKNEVDSEHLLGGLLSEGFLLAANPEDSDICLINTCGFIESAREESASVLEELHGLKDGGRPRYIIALGCLVERTIDCPSMAHFLSSADARVGFGDFVRLGEICRDLLETGPDGYSPGAHKTLATEFGQGPRLRIGPSHAAYLKISEGCSNGCRFCSIPRIRGKQISRPIEDIVREGHELIASGAAEIDLIAQDTTSYGKDLYGKKRLAELLKSLLQLKSDAWIRLMYAYPHNLDDEMLAVMASDERICPYIDIPLQHVSERVLKSMGRTFRRSDTDRLIADIKDRLPGGAIRTTFIVGYPGETEQEFQELLDFVKEGHFMHVGAFRYCPEPLTASAEMNDDVPEDEKERRQDELMLAQLEVSRRRLESFVNETMMVLLDDYVDVPPDDMKDLAGVGRTTLQAPEVDGVVLLRGLLAEHGGPGTRLPVLIEKSLDYDMIGRIL